MKKGFTMIELIFVIVILGILASVAIPRLAATRTDAEIATTVANLRTLLNDVASYYAVKGEFDSTVKWRDITNVPLKDENGAAITSSLKAIGDQTYLSVNRKNCLQIGMRDSATSTFIAFRSVEANKNDSACSKVLESDLVKPILESTIPSSGKQDGTENCTGVKNGGMSCINITTSSIY